MSAIENCRTAALGGHVARCENEKCGHTQIAYNSCRNRHCPKCQGAAAREWLAEREAELLPVPYFHVVLAAGSNRRYSLPEQGRNLRHPVQGFGRDHAHHRGRSQTPRRPHRYPLGLAHLHMIVPGGGISLDGTRWVACRPNFLLAVEVLSCLFRRLVLEKLAAAHCAGELQ